MLCAMALGSTAAAAGAHTYDPSTIGESAGLGQVNGQQATAATGGRSIADATKTITEGTRVSLSGAARNSVYACQEGSANAPGSSSTPWLKNGSFTFADKPTVDGKVYWQNARVRVYTTSGGRRVITANGQPRKTPTGVFPIATDSTAYQYDENPGTVGSRTVKVNMPKTHTRLSTPRCLPAGVIGYLSNGTALFNALDARGEDAVAHEVLDLCQGHPAGELYHYLAAVAFTIARRVHPQPPSVGIHNRRGWASTISGPSHPQPPGVNSRAGLCTSRVGGPQTARPPPPPRWGTGARLAPNLRPTACRCASFPVVSCHLDAGAEGTRIASNHAAFRGVESEADERTRTADPFITSEVLYQLSYVGTRRRMLADRRG